VFPVIRRKLVLNYRSGLCNVDDAIWKLLMVVYRLDVEIHFTNISHA